MCESENMTGTHAILCIVESVLCTDNHYLLMEQLCIIILSVAVFLFPLTMNLPSILQLKAAIYTVYAEPCLMLEANYSREITTSLV